MNSKPDLTSPLAKDITIKNNILFFTKSCLSQWFGAYKGQEHKIEILPLLFNNSDLYWWSDVDKTSPPISFNCAEQAMMFYKALFFRDKETSEKILNEKNPKIQKDLGRQVKNYDDVAWVKHRFHAVKTINLHKFKDNPELKDFLLSTGNLIICESAPWDRVWGIGLSAVNPLAHDVSTWQGQNLLGRVLMSIREELSHA